MEEARKDTAEMENIDTPAEETPAAAEESEELLSDGAMDNQLSQLENHLRRVRTSTQDCLLNSETSAYAPKRSRKAFTPLPFRRALRHFCLCSTISTER